jgi:hypothetical protein
LIVLQKGGKKSPPRLHFCGVVSYFSTLSALSEISSKTRNAFNWNGLMTAASNGIAVAI